MKEYTISCVSDSQCNNNGLLCTKQARKEPYIIDEIHHLLNRHCYERIRIQNEPVQLCQCNENALPCTKQARKEAYVEFSGQYLNKGCAARKMKQQKTILHFYSLCLYITTDTIKLSLYMRFIILW